MPLLQLLQSHPGVVDNDVNHLIVRPGTGTEISNQTGYM